MIVQCQFCRKTHQVADHLAGKVGRCSCGNRLRLEEDTPPRKPRRKSPWLWLLLLLLVAGAGVLVFTVMLPAMKDHGLVPSGSVTGDKLHDIIQADILADVKRRHDPLEPVMETVTFLSFTDPKTVWYQKTDYPRDEGLAVGRPEDTFIKCLLVGVRYQNSGKKFLGTPVTNDAWYLLRHDTHAIVPVSLLGRHGAYTSNYTPGEPPQVWTDTQMKEWCDQQRRLQRQVKR